MSEKRIAQLFVNGLAGRDRHAGAEQAARAVRSVRPKMRERQRLEPAVAAHAVERRAQVRRGVGERAVEIEQDCAERTGARLLLRLSHRPDGGRPSGN